VEYWSSSLRNSVGVDATLQRPRGGRSCDFVTRNDRPDRAEDATDAAGQTGGVDVRGDDRRSQLAGRQRSEALRCAEARNAFRRI
jgi:hypothetical protein